MEAFDTPPTVMIVDDHPANLKLLAVILYEAGYDLVTFSRGAEALLAAVRNPPDLILLDINMPEMDGFEVCRRLKEDADLREIPVLFLSALSETETKVKALVSGGVDYVTKPFQVEEVRARVETHLKLGAFQKALRRQKQNLEAMVQVKVRELAESQLATIFALAKLTESRDNETGKHVERVQAYSLLLARELARTPSFAGQIDDQFLNDIYHATPLHDIGKVAIPDNILGKPGSLDVDEFEMMKTHTILGANTLKAVNERHPNSMLLMGIEITRSHHERWDGRGYPDGLAGTDIPLAARIMTLADVYDALRSKRVYKPAFPHEETCAKIEAGAGTQFDPHIIEVFQAIKSRFLQLSLELVDE